MLSNKYSQYSHNFEKVNMQIQNEPRSPVSESGRNYRPLSNKQDNNNLRGSNKRGSTMKNFFKKQQHSFTNKVIRERSNDKR